MAPRTKTKDVELEAEADYSPYRDKASSDLQERMAEWLLEKIDPVAHDEDGEEVELDEASFREGVRLGVALRMQFQASPENQAVLEAARAAREAGVRTDAPAPAKKRRVVKNAEPDDELDDESDEESEETEEPTPAAPKAKRTATRTKAAAPSKATPAKPATRRTTRSKVAAKPAGVGSDAPF